MTEPRRICVVTGTRADYGLLQPVMAAVAEEPDLSLQVVATGMHLSPEFGLTAREIEADGYRIDARVEMLLSSDTGAGIAKSMGLGLIGFADAFERLQPDFVMLLGDRFEALSAAAAALVMRIPVAHLSGGDVTEGAFDDAIRHSITKMAHLHFVATEEAARRVRQLGEDPAYVFTFGDPGLDHLRTLQLLDRTALETQLGLGFRKHNLLVTFHPATLEDVPSTAQFAALTAALDRLGPEVGLIFTKPNADPEGRALTGALDSYVAERANASCHTSLGQLRYLSVMAAVDAIVGNSSSGLLEAPALGKPTVNIGSRQEGRVKAWSVIDCPPEADAIYDAIQKAFEMDCTGVKSPYGDGHAAKRIVGALKAIDDPRRLLKKRFLDVDA